MNICPSLLIVRAWIGRLVCPVYVWAEDLQEAARVGQGREAVPFVQSVGIACAEQDTTQTLQGGMAHGARNQPLGQPTAPVLLQHEHITKPGERGPIGYNTSESDLPTPLIQPEAERVVERTPASRKRNTLSCAKINSYSSRQRVELLTWRQRAPIEIALQLVPPPRSEPHSWSDHCPPGGSMRDAEPPWCADWEIRCRRGGLPWDVRHVGFFFRPLRGQ
jgi:hypothetical protein